MACDLPAEWGTVPNTEFYSSLKESKADITHSSIFPKIQLSINAPAIYHNLSSLSPKQHTYPMDFVRPIFLDVVTRLCDCAANQVLYIRHLPDNLDTLRDLMRQLQDLSQDVERRADFEEQQPYSERTNEVKRWLERVPLKLKEADDFLQKGYAEIQQKCLGSCCPRHCRASYKLGKEAVKKIDAVRELISKGHFDVVAEMVPRPMIDEMPMEETGGMESMFDEVWRCVEDNKAGIIGLYGMGGVGKTTLLKKLNNNFLETSHNFDVVIWVVVSKEVKLDNIQQTIRNKLMIPDEMWNNRSQDERAAQIWERLRNKRFVLLLDDLWDRVDLSKVGVSLLSNRQQFKVVFTTRSEKVCGRMEANMKFKLHGLSREDALRLFREKVGEDVLNSHNEIPKLAEIVAKECHGLPLALVTLGSAMASRRTPEEWKSDIKLLQSYPSRFPEMGKHVFPILRFSYDNLEDNIDKTCFLYCSTFPEDHNIRDDELIQLWIGEGFFDDSENLYEAQDSGREVIKSLKFASLLEESNDETTGEQNHVKMHDVLRDMAQWLAREQGTEILVKEYDGLITSHEIARWKEVVRVSIHGYSTKFFIETPSIYPHLQTVFITGSFLETLLGMLFQSMHTLQVLNLSSNFRLMELPAEIGALISLRYLNLSETDLRTLPIEVKNLTQLRILLLENTMKGVVIPPGVISSLSSLEMFSNFVCPNWLYVKADDEARLIEELECLEKIINVSLTFSSVLGIQKFMSSSKLQSCISQLSIIDCEELHSLDITSSTMRRMKHLETLHIFGCPSMREVKICLENGERMQRSEVNCFYNLQKIIIHSCAIVNLTWLIYTPRIRSLNVVYCYSLEEIIASYFGSSEIEEDDVDIFSNLETVYFDSLTMLKSVCRRAMPFSSLRKIEVSRCGSLTKLPFSAESGKNLKEIGGFRHWWETLEWEDEATKHAFTSKFREW